MNVNYPPQRLRVLENRPTGQLLIHEIYRSVQGESTFAGLPCVFVRTTGCGQRCSWCDTPHSFVEGKLLDIDEVIRQIKSFGCPLIEFTGGEPLLQDEILPIMARLAEDRYTVLIETGGAESVHRIDPRVHVIMDLKCPDSGECERNNWANLDFLKPTDQIKFVLASRRDFDWAVQSILKHQLDQRFTVLLSAVFDKVQLSDLASWHLESGLNVRMQLQMHKFIWDPKARGV